MYGPEHLHINTYTRTPVTLSAPKRCQGCTVLNTYTLTHTHTHARYPLSSETLSGVYGPEHLHINTYTHAPSQLRVYRAVWTVLTYTLTHIHTYPLPIPAPKHCQGCTVLNTYTLTHTHTYISAPCLQGSVDGPHLHMNTSTRTPVTLSALKHCQGCMNTYTLTHIHTRPSQLRNTRGVHAPLTHTHARPLQLRNSVRRSPVPPTH